LPEPGPESKSDTSDQSDPSDEQNNRKKDGSNISSDKEIQDISPVTQVTYVTQGTTSDGSNYASDEFTEADKRRTYTCRYCNNMTFNEADHWTRTVQRENRLMGTFPKIPLGKFFLHVCLLME
jgi:hypothetical protein